MSLINPKTNLTNFLCPMSAEWNIALVPLVNYGLPALHDLEIEWKINVRYSSDVACRKIRDKKVTNFRRKRPIVWCFRSLNDGKCPEKRERLRLENDDLGRFKGSHPWLEIHSYYVRLHQLIFVPGHIHNVGKILKMSHLNFSNLVFFTNFCLT